MVYTDRYVVPSSGTVRHSCGNALAEVTALTEIPHFCSPKFPTLGRSVV